MLDLLVDRGGQEPERLVARILGREVRVARVGRKGVVQQRRHLAEAARVLRQPVVLAAHERVARQLPAVALGGHELLHGRQRRLERPALVRDVALERRCVLEGALGEEAEHLELGVHPRRDPAVELERVALVEHERAVRLLGAHRPRRLDLFGELAGRAEHDRRLGGLERGICPHQLEYPAGELRVGDRVVGDPALGLGDHGLVPAVRRGPEPEREVVEVVGLEAVAHLDDRDREDRRLARASHRRRGCARRARPSTCLRTSAATRSCRAGRARRGSGGRRSRCGSSDHSSSAGS